MSDQNLNNQRPIRRALLSVSDKSGLIDFARSLVRFSVAIISTGGTAAALREVGIPVTDVSEVTCFPEILDGRVKTLHPHIHGGLLSLRDNPLHESTRAEHGIELIDMVVVNLYPFEKTARTDASLEEVVEQIDIGGPAMIRSAAKNWRDVAVVVSPDSYGPIQEEMDRQHGALSLETRRRLAQAAFARTAQYDQSITAYLSSYFTEEEKDAPSQSLPAVINLHLKKSADLRYGENPHQRAALYDAGLSRGIAFAEQLAGKEMSFNNYVDADAAWQLVCDFEEPVCAIIKHTNPAGAAAGTSAENAYRRALSTDPVSAFGGVVAFNVALDGEAARAVTEIFTEVVIAPDYEDSALEILRSKKNLRLLRAGAPVPPSGLDYKPISGGVLVQNRDTHLLRVDNLKTVTRRAPTEKEIRSLIFAWKVCKHVKSNAIVYARDGQTIGVGAGQMSRVDSVRIGAARAQLPIENSVVASDAFFPFRDGIDEAAKHGITAVIQPGGSVRDEEVIAAADEHNLAMVFTGIRHFKH